MLCGCIMFAVQVRLPAVWLHQATDGIMALSGAVKGCPWLGSTAKTDVTFYCTNSDCAHHTAFQCGVRSRRSCVSGATVVGLCHTAPWNYVLCCWCVFFFFFLCVRIFCAVRVWLCCLSCCVGFVWGLMWSVTGHLSHNLSFDSSAAFWEHCLLKGFMAVTVDFRLLAKVKINLPHFSFIQLIYLQCHESGLT